LTFDVGPLARWAAQVCIRLTDRTDQLKGVLTILTAIFIDRHDDSNPFLDKMTLMIHFIATLGLGQFGPDDIKGNT
jgi:hypothetical protein